MDETNRNEVRAAAFLAAQARMDFVGPGRSRTGKTRKQVKCIPPNRKCGNRCIPKEWDCRIKGEGSDAHLKAVGIGIDPISGFANLERGIKRIGRGVTNLSFSELEGGKRAVARGVAKLTPGDIQQKEEAKKLVNKIALTVGIPVAIGILGALSHRGLKAFPAYRDGTGRQVDDAFNKTMAGITGSIPWVGDRIRRNRQTGVAGINHVSKATTAISNRIEMGPNLQKVVARQNLASSGSNTLRQAMNKADLVNGNPSRKPYAEWEADSLKTFWGVKRPDFSAVGVAKDGSLYSVPSANHILASSYGIRKNPGFDLDAKETYSYVLSNVSEAMQTQRSMIHVGMRQEGLDIKSAGARTAYIQKMKSSWSSGNTSIDAKIESHLESLTDPSKSTLQLAKRVHQDTIAGFDSKYEEISKAVQNPPRIGSGIRNSPYGEAVMGHGHYMAARLNWPHGVAGPGTATMLRKAYHNKFVLGGTQKSPISLSGNELVTAASELGGTSVDKAENALQYLRSFTGYNIIKTPNPNLQKPFGRSRKASTPPSAETEAPKVKQTAGQLLAQIQQEINPETGEPRFATLAAAQNELKRRQSRTDAYEQTLIRIDKRCGKSGIPENRKCSKQTSAAAAETIKGGPIATQKPGSALGTVGKVAAVAGAVAGGVYAAKNRHTLGNGAYGRFAPKVMHKGITALSQKEVTSQIAKLPKSWQTKINNLVGKAKAGAAYVSADAQGLKLRSVDKANNYSVWSDGEKKKIVTIGSVGDTLIMFNATKSSYIDIPRENGKGGHIYDVDFTSDLGFQQKKGVSKENGASVAKMVKHMNGRTMKELPEVAILRNVPYSKDAKGARRASLYRRAGYSELPGMRGNHQFAMWSNGKVQKVPEEHAYFISDLVKGRTYDEALKRQQQYGAKSRGDASDTGMSLRTQAYLQAIHRLKPQSI